MSRTFGGMRQLAMVVRDMRKTIDYWVNTLGVGPFYVLSGAEFSDYRYRGREERGPILDIALSWSGAFQIEIIQQKNDAPSAYLDFLASGREGMHHVCSWFDSPAKYDGAREKALASGAGIVHEGSIGSKAVGTSARFAYFDTIRAPEGFYFEMGEGLIPSLTPFMTMVEDSAKQWDGTDPVRLL